MKIASYIALFLTVVFLGDHLVSFTAVKLIKQSRNQFVRMYEGKNSADIIFFGDSRVDRNISYKDIQDSTRKVCLNLGLGGNNILVSEVLLQDYVQRYGNPELVVIDLGHSMVDPESMGEMRIFSYCSKGMEVLASRNDPTYTAFEHVFKSLRFNDPAFWRLLVEVFQEPSSRLLNNKIPTVLIEKWKNGGHEELPIYTENMEALKRICDYTDSKNIRTRLIISPYWKDYKNAIVNFESWKVALQKSSGQNYIYDYSEVFNEYPAYFNDIVHLNATGAKNYVKILLQDNVF
jgi:hypothetical protein